MGTIRVVFGAPAGCGHGGGREAVSIARCGKVKR
jgi:hypothetical protein